MVSKLDDQQPITVEEAELESRIRLDPYDTDAWESLVNISRPNHPDRTRAIFENLLERFPASNYWIKYAEFEESQQSQKNVEDIFKRVLLSCYATEIWQFYLNWLIRTRLTNAPKDQIKTNRTLLVEAFEEALKSENVGYAMDAYCIWKMYLDFLNQEPETNVAEHGQKLAALRKVYQRALHVAIRGLESMWKDYQAFENAMSAVTAQKFIAEMTPIFANANEILKEREAVWKPILNNPNWKVTSLPKPPMVNSAAAAVAADAWNKVLAFECTNPEHLSPVDYKIRVRLCYRKCLMELRYYPEIWYAFADFERSVSDVEASMIILRESLRAIPDSVLLRFALTESLELEGDVDGAKHLHDYYLELFPSTVGVVQKMRFLRRVEGQASARNYFRRVRADPDCDFAVYIAAAELEFRANKNPLSARKVYELALRRFPMNIVLAHKFLDLMESLNDDSACRTVYEGLIESFTKINSPNEEAMSIWKRYRRFEANNVQNGGDVASMYTIEQRLSKAFENKNELLGLASVLYRYEEVNGKFTSTFDSNFLQRMQPFVDPSSAPFYGNNGNNNMHNNFSSVSSGGGGSGHMHSSNNNNNSSNSNNNNNRPPPIELPSFLKRLNGLLPSKMQGSHIVDVGYVMKRLQEGSLPPPPIRSHSLLMVRNNNPGENVSSSSSTTGAKIETPLGFGVENAPVDQFKERMSKRQKQ